MPGIARVVVPGYPHHVTQRGTNKTTIFYDDLDKLYFIDCLKDYARRQVPEYGPIVSWIITFTFYWCLKRYLSPRKGGRPKKV